MDKEAPKEQTEAKGRIPQTVIWKSFSKEENKIRGLEISYWKERTVADWAVLPYLTCARAWIWPPAWEREAHYTLGYNLEQGTP